MASISAFERISLAEANVKALVKTISRQAIDIRYCKRRSRPS